MDGELPLSFAAIVLAAGGSSRMGRPKQLLRYRGTRLLRRAVEAAIGCGATRVVVVLGAGAEVMAAELGGLAVAVVENRQWASGMGSSIRAGMGAVMAEAAAVEAVLVTLADQPLVDAGALRGLVDAFVAGARPIAAAAYGGTIGVPAVFGRSCFGELVALADEGGAKALLQRVAERVTAVPMPRAAMDVDTPEDYARLGDR